MAANEFAWDAHLEKHDCDDAFVAIVDSDFLLRAASPSISRELEIDPRDVIGRSAAELIHPDDLLRALMSFPGGHAESGQREPDTFRIRTNSADGYRAFDVTSEAILDGAAVILQLQTPTRRDRSETLALEQIDVFEMMGDGRSLDDCLLALVVMVERFSDNSRALIHVGDDDGRLRPIASASLPRAVRDRFKDAAISAPGGDLQKALTQDFAYAGASSTPDFPEVSVVAARLPNGALAGFFELLHQSDNAADSGNPAIHAVVTRLIGLIVDRYSVESRLTESAGVDEATGLPNRRALTEIARELADGHRSYSLLALDINDFATLSADGNHLGDQVLKAVARAVQSALPHGATLFRPRSSEFVVVVPDERRSAVIAAIGAQVLEALAREAVELAGTAASVIVSIGAATTASDEHTFAEMLGRADTAMRVAKRDGDHQLRFHDQPLDSRWVHRRALAESLPNAIEANELYLEFQPIISLASHYIVGFEALSRWAHPRFGTLSPGDFLPIAEETSLIHAVDTWVLDTAARAVVGWNDANNRPLDLWVNLSARSLARQDLVEQILGLQAQHQVKIGVELTERDSFASSLHADAACEQLRAAGIKLALDDFGAGRSSLFRAVFHAPSVLKIDRSFVEGMLSSDTKLATVSTILDLGRQLGLSVIAEGVETEQQMQQLELMGCEFAQGYLFAPPLTADLIERRLGPSFRDLRVIQLSLPDEPGDDLNV